MKRNESANQQVGTRTVARANQRSCYVSFPIMKKLVVVIIFASALSVFLGGCAAPGPSPEEITKQQQEEEKSDREQAVFRQSLPPVSNPGRGQ
jgi:hypothetical protein